jgi:hypothetical protein
LSQKTGSKKKTAITGLSPSPWTYEPAWLQKLQTAANDLFAAHEKGWVQKLPGVYDLAALQPSSTLGAITVNLNDPANTDQLAAQLDLRNRHVPKAIAARITELADGGLDLFEIQSITGLALPLIRLVLRGGMPKEVTK